MRLWHRDRAPRLPAELSCRPLRLAAIGTPIDRFSVLTAPVMMRNHTLTADNDPFVGRLMNAYASEVGRWCAPSGAAAGP